MTRVAHIIASLGVGGAERTVVDLAASSRSFGVEPIIVTYTPPHARAAYLDPGDIDIVALDRTRGDRWLHDVEHTLSDRGIDVVHAHGHISSTYAAACAPTWLATLHVALGPDWRWLVPVVRALRRADVVAAVSHDLARSFGRLSRRSDIQVISTGVDLARFGSEAAGRAENRLFTVGMAARLHPIKRHVDAFAAVRLLAAEGMPIRLLVAGSGPLEAELRAAAGQHGIEFVGAVEDIAAFHSRIDAFLLCSDHEGMPLALLEAMASGLPCVATAVGGIHELVEGAAAPPLLIAPRRSPAALAAHLRRLACDPALRTALGARARRAARARSLERQASAYAAIYHRLAAQR